MARVLTTDNEGEMEMNETMQEEMAQKHQLSTRENRSYTGWGPHEDYMITKDPDFSPLDFTSWQDFKNWQQEHPHMVVLDYYHGYTCDSEKCPQCDGGGNNKATQQIEDDWYDFSGSGRKWSDRITQDEVIELVKAGRLSELTDHPYHFDETNGVWRVGLEELEGEPNYPTALEVNQWSQGRGIGHDAINRWICVKTRAKRLGVYGKCQDCQGQGYMETSDPYFMLTLWMFNTETGANRGIDIKGIQERELMLTKLYLKEQYEKLKKRFQSLGERKKRPWHTKTKQLQRGTGRSQLESLTWTEFYDIYNTCDDDLNLIGDVQFTGENQEKLELMMMYPRKGAMRPYEIQIENENQIEEIGLFLQRHWAKHEEHFAKVV